MDEQSKTILTLIVVLVLLVGVAVGRNMGFFGDDEGKLLPVNGNMVVTNTTVDTTTINPMNTLIINDVTTKSTSDNSFKWQDISDRSQNSQDLIKDAELQSSIVALVILLLTMYIEYKLYIKVGVDKNTAMWIVMAPLILIVSVVLESMTIILVAVLVALITGLNAYSKFLRLIGINPNLLWLLLVPIANYIVMLYINVMTAINLGNKFNKDVLFKIGLFFLPPIFKAILVFNDNNQAPKFGRNIDE